MFKGRKVCIRLIDVMSERMWKIVMLNGGKSVLQYDAPYYETDQISYFGSA